MQWYSYATVLCRPTSVTRRGVSGRTGTHRSTSGSTPGMRRGLVRSTAGNI